MGNNLPKSTRKRKDSPRNENDANLTSGIQRGLRLQEELEKCCRNLSQRTTAELLGADAKSLRNWINGETGINNESLAKLDELGADVRYILAGRRMPTGDCLHDKLCERLPKSMHLAAALIECACGMDKAEREAADETIRQVIALLEARQQESHRTSHAS